MGSTPYSGNQNKADAPIGAYEKIALQRVSTMAPKIGEVIPLGLKPLVFPALFGTAENPGRARARTPTQQPVWRPALHPGRDTT